MNSKDKKRNLREDNSDSDIQSSDYESNVKNSKSKTKKRRKLKDDNLESSFSQSYYEENESDSELD